jgi:hypothetical protein
MTIRRKSRVRAARDIRVSRDVRVRRGAPGVVLGKPMFSSLWEVEFKVGGAKVVVKVREADLEE